MAGREKYPDGEVVETEYDDSGQPWTLDNGSEVFVTDAQYDRFGRVKFIQHGNGVKDAREFGGAAQRHRPSRVSTVRNGTTTHLDIGLSAYNLRGQLTTLADARNTTGDLSNSGTLGYDFMGRLTSFNAPGTTRDLAYGYDAYHNIRQAGSWYFDYDDPAKPNQATDVHVGSPTAAGFPLDHDDNGARTERNGDLYEYDAEGRVDRIIGAQTVDVVYDHSGQKTVEFVAGGATTRYYSDRLATTASGQIKFYYFGGLRVASKSNATLGWQTAALDPLGPIQVAHASLDQPALVLRLDGGHGATLAAVSIVLAGGLLLARGGGAGRWSACACAMGTSPALGWCG